MIVFLYFWLALGTSIENIFDLTVIGVALAFGAVVGFGGLLARLERSMPTDSKGSSLAETNDARNKLIMSGNNCTTELHQLPPFADFFLNHIEADLYS